MTIQRVFRGFPACVCLVAWLPAYERELQRRRLLVGPLPIAQLIGNAPQSAGVHSEGGAFDIGLLPREAVWVARQMGADATWSRIVGFDTPHIHGVLRGCPHNGPARYQLDAVDAGFNGLGHLGRGGPDDGPRPLSGRTFLAGLNWQQQQEDDMPAPKDWDPEDWKAIKANLPTAPQIAAAVWKWHGFNKVGDTAKNLLLLASGKGPK